MKTLQINNLKNARYHRVMYLPILCSMLWACGGTGQDSGTVSSSSQVFSGLAIDGQIARATVYLDTNNNGKRDPWENFAFTDNRGYYSFNPITNVNYCAVDAEPQEAIYCLKSQSALDDVVIRIDEGYDILTGEPFIGQLSRRVNTELGEDVENTIVSPLTSLVSSLNDDQRSALLEAMGISSDADLNVNYLDVLNDGSQAINSNLFSAAIKLHKVVSVLADRINDTYSEIGDSFGAPNDASIFVYSAIANQILQSGVDLEIFLADEALLVNVLEEAESSIRDIYIDREYVLPTDIDSSSGTSAFNRAARIGSSIVEVVDNLVIVDDEDFDALDAVGSARALESLIIKSIQEVTLDVTVDNAIRFFSDVGDEELIESLVDSLSEETADLSALVSNDFVGDDFDSEEEIQTASSQPVGAEPFSNVAGSKLKVSDLYLGSGPDTLDDSEVEFYFHGVDGDIEGSFDACFKYIDDANIDGSLGEGNTRGELVNGFWSLLDADENDAQSYSLLVTVTFLGATYAAILKPSGTEVREGVEYERIRFDLDGDLNVWHSLEGFTLSDQSLPTSNADCRDRLPLRIPVGG